MFLLYLRADFLVRVKQHSELWCNRRQAESNVKLALNIAEARRRKAKPTDFWRRSKVDEREESRSCSNYSERGGGRRSQPTNEQREQKPNLFGLCRVASEEEVFKPQILILLTVGIYRTHLKPILTTLTWVRWIGGAAKHRTSYSSASFGIHRTHVTLHADVHNPF